MNKFLKISILAAACSCSSVALAQRYMDYNNDGNPPTRPVEMFNYEGPNVNTPMPQNEKRIYQNYNQQLNEDYLDNKPPAPPHQETEQEYFARERQVPGLPPPPPNYRQGSYMIDVMLSSNGQIVKRYNIPVKPQQEFMIVNTEETQYIESYQKYNQGNKIINKPVYAKTTSGSAITGILNPSRMRDGTVNVHLNILNNKLLGFEKSCWTSRKECTELPQQVLTKQDVVVNTSFNNPVQATEFVNSKGKTMTVILRVKYNPDY